MSTGEGLRPAPDDDAPVTVDDEVTLRAGASVSIPTAAFKNVEGLDSETEVDQWDGGVREQLFVRPMPGNA